MHRFNQQSPDSHHPVLPVPEIDLSVLVYERTATFAGILKERINNTWGKYIQIYTDGAQDPRTGKSGFAFCIPDLDVIKYKRLSEAVSVGCFLHPLCSGWRRSGQGQL